MRTVITVVAVCFAFSTLAVAEEPKNVDKQMTETVEGHSDVQDDSEIKIHMSDFAAKFIEDYVTPTICSYSPDFCARHQLRKSNISVFSIILCVCVNPRIECKVGFPLKYVLNRNTLEIDSYISYENIKKCTFGIQRLRGSVAELVYEILLVNTGNFSRPGILCCRFKL